MDGPAAPAPLADASSSDPFVSEASSRSHHRFSNFDGQLFALGPGASADQARRVLQTHLAETDRRMADAGRLGTALLQTRVQLSERLKELEQLHDTEGELSPDLKQKLVDIEKDFNEVARESARAFLPKQRVPSNEAAGSPFAPEGKGGRVSFVAGPPSGPSPKLSFPR